MKPARVLIVDDSATMRRLVSEKLGSDPRIEVLGTATDPYDAREKVKALNPTVITLDVEMPRMDGIDFLRKIMRLRPTPVIMLSSRTTPNSKETLAALEIGAFDCFAKPSMGDANGLEGLADLVVEAHKAYPAVTSRDSSPAVQSSLPDAKGSGELVAIGASTGGVEALISVVSGLPADGPPVLIVQHLPANFTASFAARLDRASPARVVEAEQGMPLEAGHVYLAPGQHHMTARRQGERLCCRLGDEPPVNGHRPSVDVLFHSLAGLGLTSMVGAILTGLGRDGAAGLKAMRDAGAFTIGQDEASSLVYGMPRAAFECGAVCRQVPLSRMTRTIFQGYPVDSAPLRSSVRPPAAGSALRAS